MTALVHELYSTARKHNTSIWTVTQKYSDYVASEVAGTINLNSTTQLFLSHASAAALRREIARDFEMHEREAFLFESLRTRKGEFSEVLLRTEIWDEAREERRPISAKLRVELSPFGREVAGRDWAFAMWGRGTVVGPGALLPPGMEDVGGVIARSLTLTGAAPGGALRHFWLPL